MNSVSWETIRNNLLYNSANVPECLLLLDGQANILEEQVKWSRGLQHTGKGQCCMFYAAIKRNERQIKNQNSGVKRSAIN